MNTGNIYTRAWRALARLVASLAALTALNPTYAQDTGWKLDPEIRFELGAVSAETATRDEQFIVNGDAFTVRAQASLDLEDDNTRFRVEADRIEVIRLDEDRRDTNRDRLTVLVEQELDDNWQIQARARYYDDLVTAESADTDEIQGSVRVRYEKDRKHRVLVRTSWREREYDNGTGPQTNGSGPRVDAQYRRRFGRYNYLTFDLRAEEINSDDPRRGYERESAKVSYTQPITPDLRVRPAIELLKTRFDNRVGSDGEDRSDTLVAPEIEAHYWPGPWRIEAEAKYIFSSSNLNSREREGYRLTLSVGYVF
ncbi:MAG: hypothetical protein AAGL10_07110 [Pseudomonadota bacterium]